MYNRHCSFNRGKRSSALVITLAMLILISALIVVFINQSTLNRQISFSSAGQNRADFMAHTAMDTIVGDLRTEIMAGSTVTTVNSSLNPPTSLYIPVTNFTMVPCRVNDQGFNNLVAQSTSGSNFWTGKYFNSAAYSPVRSAAQNSTQTPSLNGRYIKANRWNKSGLLGDPGSGTDPVGPANYTPPDWVIVTRQGPITNALSMPSVATLADKTASNPNFAVGRYAYAIYNEGGLLDVNVAGFPSSLNGSTFSNNRGLLPQVDLGNLLSNLPTPDPNATTDANALVTWRNQTSAASATSYTNYVSTATNGFTTVAAGDQTFINRGDLINYIKSNGSIPTAALQYLGTFTRDSDGPSYYPSPTRPKVNRTGLPTDDTLNPNVLTIRAQSVFIRASDGSQSVIGEPLLKHRFPLSRLALFQNPSGTSVVNGATVTNTSLLKAYFAMQTRTDGLWDYIDPDTGTVSTTLPTIKTLAQVAATAPGREPDFWELLQAGILTGSLGTTYGPNGFNAIITDQDSSTTRQILAIGLNIIAQYTPATTPPTPFVLNLGGIAPATAPATTLATATGTPASINSSTPLATVAPAPKHILDNLFISSEENLPYISWMALNMFYDLQTPQAIVDINTFTTAPWLDSYLQFLLWNPHRSATTASSGAFRLVCTGATYIAAVNNAPGVGISAPGGSGTSATVNWGTDPTAGSATAFTFPGTAQTFNPPNVLGTTPPLAGMAAVSSPVVNAQFPSPARAPIREVGVLLGQTLIVDPPAYGMYWKQAPDGSTAVASPVCNFFGTPGAKPPLSMILEVKIGSNWIPYQILPDFQPNGWGTTALQFNAVTTQLNNVNGFNSTTSNNQAGLLGMGHSDPRTSRFGLMSDASGRTGGGVTGGTTVSITGQAMLENGCNYVSENAAVPGGYGPQGTGFCFTPYTALPAVNGTGLVPTVLADYAYNLDPASFPSAASTTAGVHSYADPDGVYRKGDNNPTSTETASPLIHGADSPFNYNAPAVNDAAPVMLNRTFTSVAEMGYAYRDDPWRSLDFSSKYSADGGLLDLFCLNPNSSSLRAGVLDLNGASAPVLASVLTGAYQDPSNTTAPLTAAQATTIAAAIKTQMGPGGDPAMVLGNVADIPTLITDIAASLPNTHKYKREAVTRSFADITNTRTWNLMIDVVAQSGRYSNTSKSLDDFAVEGERRYWIHIAIDRFTGAVVSSQIEPVSE